jgi:hypothetical protein
MSTFKYGSYSHTSGTVDLVNFNTDRILDGRGKAQLVRKSMSIQGTLIGTGTQGNLKSQIEELETAYSVNGRDAVLLHDDGTQSAHTLTNGRSVGGVIVASLNYPVGGAGEYATQRSYTISLHADYLATGADNIVSWNDTVSITGTGGPRKVVLSTISGPAVVQTLAQRTPVRATQSGSGVGFNSWPPPPRPFSAQNEEQERRSIKRTQPERRNRQFSNYAISWSYSFSSASPLIGYPSQK